VRVEYEKEMNAPPHPQTPSPPEPLDYWQESRQPIAGLIFVAPLLVGYEAGVLILGPQAIRNGADVWLRGLLDLLDLGQYFLLPVLTVGILLAWHHATQRPWRVSRGVLPGMLVETVLLALCLRVILQVQTLGWRMMAHSPALSWQQAGALPEAAYTWAGVIGFFGAGVYEELLFRLILLSAVVWAMRQSGMAAKPAAAAAMLATSFLFAAAHYVGPYGDAIQWAAYAFWFGLLFRFLAGVFFSILFLSRGFGIAAGAHAGYNILVKLL